MAVNRRDFLKAGGTTTLGALVVAMGANAEIVDEEDQGLELSDGMISVRTISGELRTYRVGIEEIRHERSREVIRTKPKLHRIS